MRAARLPGSGPTRRTTTPLDSVSYVTPASAGFRADPGDRLWLPLPPGQCRWYDPETQLLLEAKE